MSEHIADINTVTDEEVTLDHNRNMLHEKATADTIAVREKKFRAFVASKQNRQKTFVK